jgi:hypothetical protein
LAIIDAGDSDILAQWTWFTYLNLFLDFSFYAKDQ